MSSTPSLFDQPDEPPARKGERLRDEAITRAREHAPDEWYSLAWDAVRIVARAADEWTTDEVWALLDERGAPAPPEPRAMGAIMRDVKRRGLATPTDRTRLSTRPDCHRRPIRVWRSS